MPISATNEYRSDIDSLRAIAVLAVLAYHCGFLPLGFLGVDVFFVISGYLITNIVVGEIEQDKFSLAGFYMRRIRRILPLELVVSGCALAAGVLVMLPWELKGLAESVIATNLFSNNILQVLTTRNYWDVVNEYKPLMHTWSLGVEEQYYLAYPVLLLLFRRSRRIGIGVLVVAGVCSFVAYMAPVRHDLRFYLMPFRFWELATGAVAAVVLKKHVLKWRYAWVATASIGALMLLRLPGVAPHLIVLPAVTLSVLAVVSGCQSVPLLASGVLPFIGKLSYSLYMWHQIVLAYTRYCLVERFEAWDAFWVVLATFVLSIGSYYCVEKPFRDRKRITSVGVIAFVAVLFAVAMAPAALIYRCGGVIRSVPELDIDERGQGSTQHAAYNDRISSLNGAFAPASGNRRVLLIGNSFARDWAQVILESAYAPVVDIRYVAVVSADTVFQQQVKEADIIFTSVMEQEWLKSAGVPLAKTWAIGTKNFGRSNGYVYHHMKPGDYTFRVEMEDGFLELNKRQHCIWSGRYIDIIGKLADTQGRMPVFTSDGKFISHDGRHLTAAGARWLAGQFTVELGTLLLSGKDGR